MPTPRRRTILVTLAAAWSSVLLTACGTVSASQTPGPAEGSRERPELPRARPPSSYCWERKEPSFLSRRPNWRR